MDKTIQIGVSYFQEAFGDASELIDNARKSLEWVDYDTMIGTGLSGSLVIPILAHALCKNFAIVRKEESPHDSGLIVGTIGQKWIFVDDFISSGTTFKRVKAAVENTLLKVQLNPQTWEYETFPTEFVGSYLYAKSYFGGSIGFRPA